MLSNQSNSLGHAHTADARPIVTASQCTGKYQLKLGKSVETGFSQVSSRSTSRSSAAAATYSWTLLAVGSTCVAADADGATATRTTGLR